MNTYTFPLRPSKAAIMPVSLVTNDTVSTLPIINDCLLIWADGKSCHICINFVFDIESGCKGLHDVLVMPNMGNTIVSDGTQWYQIAYKQISPKM